MKTKTIIRPDEVPFGATLVLKNGDEAIVKGYIDSMLPTIDEIYEFYTDKGIIKPEQVEQIIVQGKRIFK